jgi:PIN domain
VKVVVDTNVLVSGLLFGGVPGQILGAWTTGAFVLVVSPSILREYSRVGRELAKGQPALDAAFDALLALIALPAVYRCPRRMQQQDQSPEAYGLRLPRRRVLLPQDLRGVSRNSWMNHFFSSLLSHDTY